MPFIERRLFKRTSANFSFALLSEASSPDLHTATALNISTGSICFKSDVLLKVGQRIEMQIPMISGMLSLSAVVARAQVNFYGCQFIDVDPQTASKLKNWLFPPFEP